MNDAVRRGFVPYIAIGWKGLPGTNTLPYLRPFISYEEHDVL
jgi:hypothetical protein